MYRQPRYETHMDMMTPQSGRAGPPRGGRAVGARGPAVGPRVDLAQADTGLAEHQLYVKIVDGNDPDTKSPQITRDLLKYVVGIKPTLEKMGVAVRVSQVKSTSLRNRELVDAMKRRGIARLPALTTPDNVYLGEKEIRDVYERNLKEFQAFGRRDERPVGVDLEDDALQAYYQGEMTVEQADQDAEEIGIGEGGENMMEAFQEMVSRRAQSRPARPGRADADREGPPEGRRGPAGHAPRREEPYRPAGRPDNVRDTRGARGGRAPNRGPAQLDDDPVGDETQALIAQFSRDGDYEDVRQRAFASGGKGGDSYADDDGDTLDDLMEAAHWSNKEVSDY